ncbi:serine/threonine-protein kinase Nek11 isoform X1 [Megalobrama amblycephala]|uniref:serine/threonine-protein kinase Nek11 isoform X1 n=1 Tax=Megalobrama amblycephala TaxID=75352 RepID=UPI0020142973|nr:serine/threonine-protein kinase Nek11 isoform X1 [Megalobrama amblycephala]XP_048009526.1 serine/threonine-protein kinase Nek11 isoform X1 [Megalobrama amblycephala]
MPRFRERPGQTHCLPSTQTSSDPSSLIANRYIIQQRLGKGSFGTVYLVKDTKAVAADKLKVLKEIPVGDLKPNETVHAIQEAQLLSQLNHPAILKFYTSFLERDAFCIITEYCEDKDLDCKLEELKRTGRTLSEPQVCEWLCQLLLGVHYIHQRRILHRDLKAKNIFLRKNIVKIGDFGVSCLLMGSCDLATTFTGTPYYMSPEALSHRGYDSKSDIWSLGCILYEMCCLVHAFEGQNFLAVVLKIVEGPTPSLPETYSQQLNSLMQSMLEKDSSHRISAADALRSRFIEESLQSMKHKFFSLTLRDKSMGGERDASQILRALQKKVHLQTLRERSEVQKMSPRERMRLRKLQAADEKARKMKKIVEEKYQENHLRMQEYKSKNFQKVSVDVLKVRTEGGVNKTQPIQSETPKGNSELAGSISHLSDKMCKSLSKDHAIPEDPQVAEAFYSVDEFESCSEADSDGEEDSEDNLPTDPSCQTFGQDSDLEAMIRHMEKVLDGDSDGAEAEEEKPQLGSLGVSSMNTSMAEGRIERMRRSVCRRLGEEVFLKVYDYLKQARQRQESEESIKQALIQLVEKPSDCFEVDQLLYYEELLLAAQENTVRVQSGRSVRCGRDSRITAVPLIARSHQP